MFDLVDTLLPLITDSEQKVFHQDCLNKVRSGHALYDSLRLLKELDL